MKPAQTRSGGKARRIATGNHPTRELLLDAGTRLAERQSLLKTSIDELVAEAGVAKGTFYVHFADRPAFLVALHGRFYAQLNTSIAAAVEGLPAGPERLQRGALAYLDGCLGAKAVKALLMEARTVAEVGGEIAAQTDLFAVAAGLDMAAIGMAEPEACGRLFVTMVSEIALLELEKGGPDPKLRAALWLLAGVKGPGPVRAPA